MYFLNDPNLFSKVKNTCSTCMYYICIRVIKIICKKKKKNWDFIFGGKGFLIF